VSLELCFLESVRNQSVDALSKGYKHRTCFAQSIIHDPDVLILDEPTDGLDPNQKHEVRGLIKRMGQNKAIIFSTPHPGGGGSGLLHAPSSSTAARLWPMARPMS